MKPTSSAARSLHCAVLLGMLLAAVAGLGGCAQDVAGDTAAPAEPVEAPDWIERIHPEPGAEASATPQVQVVHGAVGVREGVRLVVDDVDVTEYVAPARPGVLAYDPNRPQAPVELGPGTHHARALRVSLDEFGNQHEVLDVFEWRFTIQ